MKLWSANAFDLDKSMFLLCYKEMNSYPFPYQQLLDASKLKEFSDYNFKCDENGRKLSKWVEKHCGKGEISHYMQFLLFSQCFQKTCTGDNE